MEQRVPVVSAETDIWTFTDCNADLCMEPDRKHTTHLFTARKQRYEFRRFNPDCIQSGLKVLQSSSGLLLHLFLLLAYSS